MGLYLNLFKKLTIIYICLKTNYYFDLSNTVRFRITSVVTVACPPVVGNFFSPCKVKFKGCSRYFANQYCPVYSILCTNHFKSENKKLNTQNLLIKLYILYTDYIYAILKFSII